MYFKKLKADTSFLINSGPQCVNPISSTPSKKDEGINPENGPQNIPKDIEINLLTIGVHKLNKFKFPAHDKRDPNSWDTPFTNKQCIEHIINLSACKLVKDTYEFWNEIDGRGNRVN